MTPYRFALYVAPGLVMFGALVAEIVARGVA